MSDEQEGEGPPLPRPPVFNVPQVFATRARLMDLALSERVGAVMEGTPFERTVEAVRRELNGSGDRVEHLPVFNSMRHLAGRELTPRLAFETAWRIAGNVARLKAGLPCGPWTRQTAPEWVPVQVVAARYAIQKKPNEKFGRSGRTFRFRVLAGTPCPMELLQWWSNEKADVVAYAVGFKRRPPLYKADHAELMSTRFLGLIDPARSLREPSFFHVNCPASLLEYNRDLIKKRRRIGFACPEGYDHQCHQCPLGARSCPAAVHPEDYEARPCPACGKTEWFDTDPGFVNDNCLHCQPLINVGIPVKKGPTPQESKP